ncbi:zinc-dependent peptidase [Robertkochia flava]|uniref:zinc-dependent peptidase n=1 Tax=Robertkochia flava TaxID=3447986 RepID=UPI001CCC15BF|nr:zinc-dependent peptidase [Robertkochia marina]
MINLVKSTYINVRHRLIDLFLSSTKKAVYHQVLLRHNTYYRGLSPEGKRNFIIRTHLFIGTTRFRSQEGLSVPLVMKIILSAAFVQVTFGLNEDVLEYFNRIVIFSGPYSYKNTSKRFKGDVNPRTRTINLSWPSVARGFEDAEDGINLAIHEFAHCLILENSRRSYLNRILNASDLRAWKLQAVVLLRQIRNGQAPFFRAYGGTNLMELFAVSLELFFEKPEAFARENPEFYQCMTMLLKQDPRFTPYPPLP